MNNKNYFIFAAAIALASCSVDEYMGENPEFTQTTKENIIGFGGGTGSMSRATSNTGPTNEMLDNQFKVYGWKTVKVGETTTTQKVFDNYWVWYAENATPSNPETASPDKSWEYVGKKDYQFTLADNKTKSEKLPQDQYIKYWDYSADNYKFVAGSPITSFDFQPSSGEVEITTTTVKGLAGHINPNPIGGEDPVIKPNPVYLAKPKIIKEAYYKQAVNLEFTRLQTRVRVGIYETIPGYSIESIEFYKQENNALTTETSPNQNNVILTSATPNYFNGGAKVKATVNYTWGDGNTDPTYTVSYGLAEDGSNGDFVQAKNWYGGMFDGVKATSSNPTGTNAISDLYGTDKDMDNTTGYFTVLSTTEPTPSALVIKCDFTLKAVDTNEEIKVTGATAAIPAAYCKWDDNKMYTYIFKISQETNGYTGDEDNPNKSGLFPITFDAAAEATEEGTETIVQTPSITTYQEGSVTDKGIEYKTGKDIVITVQKGSEEQPVNLINGSQGCVKVYYLGNTEKTEAELVVTKPTTVTTSTVTTEGNTAKFKPEATEFTGTTGDFGYYAIEYCYKAPPSAVYKYKVIKVKRE